MFNNKIISIFARTLGAIFLLIVGYSIVISVIDMIIFYNLQAIIIIGISYILYLTIVAFICICIGEFVIWIFDKLSK